LNFKYQDPETPEPPSRVKFITSDKRVADQKRKAEKREKKSGAEIIEIVGKTVSEALIKLKIAIIMAKLTDIQLDIEEIITLIEKDKKDEKNRNYHIYARSLDRIR